LVKKSRRPKRASSATIPPVKHVGISKLVRKFIEEEKYAPTGHAKIRLDQREVNMKEVRTALLSGKRAVAKDKFHTHDACGNEIHRWSYAFTKNGLDKKIKVCVSINESHEKPLLIITVIDLN